MFSSPLSLHYTGSSNQTETHNDETTAVTHVKLVLDSLTPQIAKEISPEFYQSFFTKDGQIHDHVSKVTIRMREPQQCVMVRIAEDMDPTVEMRHVRVPTITVTKRGEEKDEAPARKSRKVAPTTATLRATLNCLMLPETSQVREFLCRMPGNTFIVNFEDEAKQLDFGPDPEDADDDEGDEEQLALGDAPAPAKPRLISEVRREKVVAAALAEIDIELTPKQLAAMSTEQRQEAIDWVEAYQHARERNMDLPAPPAFILNPTLLVPPTPEPEAGDVLEDQPTTKPRAKRRSSAEFKNTVGDQQKAKNGRRGVIKGKK